MYNLFFKINKKIPNFGDFFSCLATAAAQISLRTLFTVIVLDNERAHG